MNVLITGGSKGIGFAIAKKLGQEGHRLLITGRDKTTLIRAQSLLPEHTLVLRSDVGELNSAEQLGQFAEKAEFRPDVLVLNAAAFFDETLSVIQSDAAELERLLNTNLLANVRIVQNLLSALEQSEFPRIILVGSTTALRHDSSFYAISKAALQSYARGLRAELKHKGIGVTLLHPGGTFTERRVPTDTISSDRLLESEDIAALVSVMLTLSKQAVVEELVVRPMLGDTY
jgi:short-subunit dehydrogenase